MTTLSPASYGEKRPVGSMVIALVDLRTLFREDRELRFTSSGSIRLSEIEHQAYEIRLTVEITDVAGLTYQNFKMLPATDHYGYLTALKGSAVVSLSPVKFAKERVYSERHLNLWLWHQCNEDRALSDGLTSLLLYRYIAAEIYEDAPFYLRMIWQLPFNEEEQANYLRVQLEELLGEDLPAIEEELVDNNNGYYSFPLTSPYPDVFKFKSDRPCSFLFRLECFYLVNPLYYSVITPVDTSDETEGEDEYPTPTQIPPGTEPSFPAPNGADPNSDPRDYGAGSGTVPPGTTMRISYTRKAYTVGCVKGSFPDSVEVGYFGSTDVSLEFIGSVSGCDGPSTAGGLRLLIPGASSVELAVLEEQQWSLGTIDNVELLFP